MQGKKILILDADVVVRHSLAQAFNQEGAQVFTVSSGKEALRHFITVQPDLLILDLLLPGEESLKICRQIRENSNVPIIILASGNQEDLITRALDAGADDYIVKPFSNMVLMAQTRAVLRRTQAAVQTGFRGYRDDYLVVDLLQQQVKVEGRLVKLSRTEYRLLAYMVTHAGHLLTFRQILENVWGWEYQESVGYVHVYISHLRRKLEKNPKQPVYLISDHGIGYRFTVQTAGRE